MLVGMLDDGGMPRSLKTYDHRLRDLTQHGECAARANTRGRFRRGSPKLAGEALQAGAATQLVIGPPPFTRGENSGWRRAPPMGHAACSGSHEWDGRARMSQPVHGLLARDTWTTL